MWQRGWRHHDGNWNGTTSLVEVWSSRRQRRERKPPWLQHKQGKTSSSRKKQAKVKPFTTQTNKVTFPPKSDSIWKTRSVNLEAGPSFHFGIKNTHYFDESRQRKSIWRRIGLRLMNVISEERTFEEQMRREWLLNWDDATIWRMASSCKICHRLKFTTGPTPDVCSTFSISTLMAKCFFLPDTPQKARDPQLNWSSAMPLFLTDLFVSSYPIMSQTNERESGVHLLFPRSGKLVSEN